MGPESSGGGGGAGEIGGLRSKMRRGRRHPKGKRCISKKDIVEGGGEC